MTKPRIWASFARQASQILASRLFLLVFVSLFAILFTVTYANLEAAPQSQFFTLSTLGSKTLASGYYPNDNLLLSPGDTMNWNVQVYNHMGGTEYVSIRVKVLNANQYGPDDSLHLPSPAVHIHEEKHVIANNSTWTMPLVLSVTGFDQDSNTITGLSVNGKKIDNLNISNDGSSSFRVIVELWRYDMKFRDFVFIWPLGTDKIGSAWNQIWIEIK